MEVGCRFLLHGIFPTQGLNPGLLHCRQILYQLSHQGSLRKFRRGGKVDVIFSILWTMFLSKRKFESKTRTRDRVFDSGVSVLDVTPRSLGKACLDRLQIPTPKSLFGCCTSRMEAISTCGYKALEMWLVQIEMCHYCKIYIKLWDLVSKTIKYLINTLMIVHWNDDILDTLN